MDVFNLILLTTDFTNGEANVIVISFASLQDAKKELDSLLEKQIPIFEDAGNEFLIDRMYSIEMPEEEMTNENCFDIRIHNDNGLSVRMQIQETSVLSIR